MGVGTSKYFRLRNEKMSSKKTANPSKKSCRNSAEIKDDVLRQLTSGCVVRSPHIKKGGVAFYTPLIEDYSRCDVSPEKPSPMLCTTTSHSHSDALAESFTAKEREIMADVLKADNLREKGRWAKISEERRMMALRRRKTREENTRQRHLTKMREAEQRRQTVQERPRPTRRAPDEQA